MIEFAGLDLRSATTARPTREGTPGDDPSGFAALLATLGSLPAEPAARADAARPEPLALPGGKARQAELREALEAALAGLAQPAEAEATTVDTDAPVAEGATPEADAQLAEGAAVTASAPVAEGIPETVPQRNATEAEPPGDGPMPGPAAPAAAAPSLTATPPAASEAPPPAAAPDAAPQTAASPAPTLATAATPEAAAPVVAPQRPPQVNTAAAPATASPVNAAPAQTPAEPLDIPADRREAPATTPLAAPTAAPAQIAPTAAQTPAAAMHSPSEPPQAAPGAAFTSQQAEAIWYRPAPQPDAAGQAQVQVTSPAQPGLPIAATSAPAQPAAPAAGPIDLPALAARLDATLQQFDATYGTDTRALIARNAAALPAQSLAAPIETPQQFVAVARGLLGLAAEPAPQDSRVLAADGNTVPSVAALIGRTSAAPRDPVPSQLPAGAERIAAADLAPLRPADPAAPQTATAAPQPQGPSFAANLAAQVKGVQLTEGTTRVELAPRGLGGLEIDVATDDQGGLKVIIRAENPSVLQALRDGREALLAVLRDSGAEVQDSALGFENFGRDSRQQTPQDQPQGDAAAAPAEDDLPADAPAPVAAPLPEGQVDIIT